MDGENDQNPYAIVGKYIMFEHVGRHGDYLDGYYRITGYWNGKYWLDNQHIVILDEMDNYTIFDIYLQKG